MDANTPAVALTVLQEEKALLQRLKQLRHTKRPRELIEALEAGWLPQGTRLVDPKNPEEGKVFVFNPDEAAALAVPLRAIAAAQLKKYIACVALCIALLAGIAFMGDPSLSQDALLAMTVQLSVAVRNGMLDTIETAIGTSAIVKLKSGAPPANCAAADSGTVIATINLASDWMAAASAGSKAFSSTPLTDASADNAGTIAHYRVYASDGTTCHEQGTVTATGGGGDMTVDNAVVAAGQQVSITSWTQNMSGHA